MANPRSGHKHNEIHTQRDSFTAGAGLVYERDVPYGTSHVDAPVKLSAADTVVLCAADDVPFGSLTRLEPDGTAVVAWHGAVPFNKGTVVAITGQKIVATGTGGVKNAVAPAGIGRAVDFDGADKVLVYI